MSAPLKKILIADGDEDLIRLLKEDPRSSLYSIDIAKTGHECVEKIASFVPDLAIIDFMLPGMHGIEVLTTVKKTHPSLGIILSSYTAVAQNYNSALKLGASYILDKPWTCDRVFDVISQYFENTLKAKPFTPKAQELEPPPASPLESKDLCYLKFWGTRGSNPVAGQEYVQFGGCTPSLEVRNKDDFLLIDAGSGIRGLGQRLSESSKKPIHILLSHTHWDHLLGFPFFFPLYQSTQEIHIWSPVGYEKTTKELFADMLGYAYFPVALDEVQSHVLFHDIRDSETLNFGSIQVQTHYAFHPGPTLCFTLTLNDTKIGYVTDNEFLYGCKEKAQDVEENSPYYSAYTRLMHFLSDCDILIHEAQYLDEEYESRVGWGHSSITNASLLVKALGIKTWIVTHHDPKHTDELLVQKYQKHMDVMQALECDCEIIIAYDGMTLPL